MYTRTSRPGLSINQNPLTMHIYSKPSNLGGTSTFSKAVVAPPWPKRFHFRKKHHLFESFYGRAFPGIVMSSYIPVEEMHSLSKLTQAFPLQSSTLQLILFHFPIAPVPEVPILQDNKKKQQRKKSNIHAWFQTIFCLLWIDDFRWLNGKYSTHVFEYLSKCQKKVST